MRRKLKGFFESLDFILLIPRLGYCGHRLRTIQLNSAELSQTQLFRSYKSRKTKWVNDRRESQALSVYFKKEFMQLDLIHSSK